MNPLVGGEMADLAYAFDLLGGHSPDRSHVEITIVRKGPAWRGGGGGYMGLCHPTHECGARARA